MQVPLFFFGSNLVSFENDLVYLTEIRWHSPLYTHQPSFLTASKVSLLTVRRLIVDQFLKENKNPVALKQLYATDTEELRKRQGASCHGTHTCPSAPRAPPVCPPKVSPSSAAGCPRPEGRGDRGPLPFMVHLRQ